jgi:hypothetical protein
MIYIMLIPLLIKVMNRISQSQLLVEGITRRNEVNELQYQSVKRLHLY